MAAAGLVLTMHEKKVLTDKPTSEPRLLQVLVFIFCHERTGTPTWRMGGKHEIEKDERLSLAAPSTQPARNERGTGPGRRQDVSNVEHSNDEEKQEGEVKKEQTRFGSSSFVGSHDAKRKKAGVQLVTDEAVYDYGDNDNDRANDDDEEIGGNDAESPRPGAFAVGQDRNMRSRSSGNITAATTSGATRNTNRAFRRNGVGSSEQITAVATVVQSRPDSIPSTIETSDVPCITLYRDKRVWTVFCLLLIACIGLAAGLVLSFLQEDDNNNPSPIDSSTQNATVAPSPSPTTAAPTVVTDSPTSSPTMRNLEEFLARKSPDGGAALLSSESNPPKQALEWLLNDDTLALASLPSYRTLQRYVLQVLRYSVIGDAGSDTLVNWQNGTASECDWLGVTCNMLSKVTEVMLQSMNLATTLPDELVLLSDLGKCLTNRIMFCKLNVVEPNDLLRRIRH